ncbi:MAG: hypothetical protein J7502_06630 [Flavisolibacter sp.]|nr:hypothetical protein [Flavisolibacter sp.]
MSHKNKIAELFLGCLQYGAPTTDNDTEIAMIRRYKFQNIGDDKKMRSCIDLLEDTECAIINFCEYQLCTNLKKDDLGERYLRLYGVLNAIYLQIHSIIEIAEVVKYPLKKKVINDFFNHKIFELRNIAGSHMVNYKTGKSETFISPPNRLNYFRLTQCDFKRDGQSVVMVDGFGNYENFNLRELVYDYNIISENWLISICEKYTGTLFKTNPNLKSKYHEVLNDLKKVPFDYRKLDKHKNVEALRMRKIEKILAEIEARNRTYNSGE